jgi:hypothetical protein
VRERQRERQRRRRPRGEAPCHLNPPNHLTLLSIALVSSKRRGGGAKALQEIIQCTSQFICYDEKSVPLCDLRDNSKASEERDEMKETSTCAISFHN